jgi:hypothetical protein
LFGSIVSPSVAVRCRKIRDTAQQKLNDLEPRAKTIDAAKTQKELSDAKVLQASTQAAFDAAKQARDGAAATLKTAQAMDKQAKDEAKAAAKKAKEQRDKRDL